VQDSSAEEEVIVIEDDSSGYEDVGDINAVMASYPPLPPSQEAADWIHVLDYYHEALWCFSPVKTISRRQHISWACGQGHGGQVSVRVIDAC
jgi:hypothetical protein